MSIKIRALTISDSRLLAKILNGDKNLQHELSQNSTVKRLTGKSFYSQTKSWEKINNAKSFSIILDKTPIGMISLSHIDYKNRQARIGYWLSSSHWGQGCASRAFNIMLKKARNLGLITVGCKIQKNNIASLSIWKKYGAKQKKINQNYLLVELHF